MPKIIFPVCKCCGSEYVHKCPVCGGMFCYECTLIVDEETCVHETMDIFDGEWYKE